MRKLGGIVALVGIAAVVGSVGARASDGTTTTTTAPPQSGPVLDPAAGHLLFGLVNAERAAAGLPLLGVDTALTAVAARHSEAQAARGEIWHNDSLFMVATKQRFGAKSVGENVALNPSVSDAHARLMASPSHRANILNIRFRLAGMAVAVAPNGERYVTEVFMEPAAAAPDGPTAVPGRTAGAAVPAPTRPARPAVSGAARTMQAAGAGTAAGGAPAGVVVDPEALASLVVTSADPRGTTRFVRAANDTKHEQPVAAGLVGLVILTGVVVLGCAHRP